MPDRPNEAVARVYSPTDNDFAPNGISPHDGGMSDPIRRGMTPARAAKHRVFLSAPLQPDENVDWVGGKEEHRVGADMPVGMHDPTDEYRFLTSGVHA